MNAFWFRLFDTPDDFIRQFRNLIGSLLLLLPGFNIFRSESPEFADLEAREMPYPCEMSDLSF